MRKFLNPICPLFLLGFFFSTPWISPRAATSEFQQVILSKNANDLGINFRRHPNGGGKIGPKAQVAQTVFVSSRSYVVDNAILSENVVVEGAVVIGGNAKVKGKASILGSAWVFGDSEISGKAVIKDFAQIASGQIGDSAEIGGHTIVAGPAKIGGFTKALGMEYFEESNHFGSEIFVGPEPNPSFFQKVSKYNLERLNEIEMNSIPQQSNNPSLGFSFIYSNLENEDKIQPLSKAQGLKIFKEISNQKEFLWGHPFAGKLGCHKRATLVNTFLESKGVFSFKVAIESKRNLLRSFLSSPKQSLVGLLKGVSALDQSKALLNWGHHTVPAFLGLDSNGKSKILVIDPLFFEGPIELATWASTFLGDTHPDSEVRFLLFHRYASDPRFAFQRPKHYVMPSKKFETDPEKVFVAIAESLKRELDSAAP